MAEVKASELEVGKDYYIQMVGQYKNHHRRSGKAIGRGFIKTVTFADLEGRPRGAGIGPDNFNDDHVFVEFREVVPIPGEECGICNFKYFPVPDPSYHDRDEEGKQNHTGGYLFFEMPTQSGGKKRRRKRKSRSRRNTRKRRRKKTRRKKRRRKKRTKRKR